jgi:HSP20 family protein
MTTSTTATPATTERQAPERVTRTVTPPVDIYETDKAFIVLADMPGVGPEGLDVTAEADTLTIRGRAEPPSEEPDYQEFELGEYRRTFALTEDLDVSAVTAALKDGVLRLEIPKSPRLQPKKIPVRAE